MAKRKSAARTVEPLAGCKGAATVYEDENGVVWNFMLNYTNISYGSYGNNKFYMVQLIQDGKNYKVFRKWGRVGAVNPQRALESYNTSLEKAKASFQKKFEDKSGNEWPLEGSFEKVAGKYVLVELDDQEPDDEGEAEAEASDGQEEKDVVPSALHEDVQDVLKLICDADLIAQEMEKMKIDLKRLPLGRLSKTQISQGYTLLQKLSNALTEIDELQKQDARGGDQSTTSPKKPATRRSARPKRVSTANASKIRKLKIELKELSSEFYTLIPHDFGRSLPPAIDTVAEVKLKIDLLEVLADIEISQKLQKEKRRTKQEGEDAINLLDVQYNMLNVKMEPLAESEEEFQVIDRYVKTTHAPTHVQYKLKIRSVLKITRPSEDAFQQEFESISNHKLLWHGSRLSNVVGILSKGLRIAPPEAPSNGYMFGKGGVLILAEVALGTSYEALEAENLSYDSLKSSRNCDSTHGLGRMASPAEHHEILDGGMVVPIGEFEPTEANGELLYNEYVVYRQEQVKLRYMVTLDFEYDI